MLFDAAALMTSVALGPVAEAFGVHEISSQVIVISQVDPSYIPLPDTPPLPFITPDQAASSQITTRALQQLSRLPSTAIAGFVRSHPDLVTEMLANPPASTEVTRWWGHLDFESRVALRGATPELVGNLNGIPYGVRDLANRVVLTTTIARLESVIDSSAGRTVIENAKQQLAMLQSISDALGDLGDEAEPKRSLMTLDVSGQGRASIILGDLRNADYVTYLVPGMFFTIENQMGDWVDASARLYDEQLSWLALLGPGEAAGGATSVTAASSADGTSAQSTSADGSATSSAAATSSPAATSSAAAVSSPAATSSAAPASSPAATSSTASAAGVTETVATIAWIGYPTPNLTNVGGIENAYEGRDSLAGDIEGLQALRGDDEPYITVVAHSYGSTAALMALTEGEFSIDALAMVGSPGSPAKSVDDLHVRNGNVWVGEAAWDPIPNSAYFGSDPGSASYGAKPLGVNGGRDSLTEQALKASTGHNEYFSPGTESMRNFALIGIGHGDYVSNGDDSISIAAPGAGKAVRAAAKGSATS